MPFHLAAYTASALGTTANTDINAVTDNIMNVQNNHFLPQVNSSLLFAYAGSPTLIRARFTSPTLRQISQLYVRPVNLGVLPVNNANVAWYGDRPFPIKGLEELAMEATANPGTTERFYALAAIADNPQPAPVGPAYFFRFTSTSTAVVATWTTISLTFETQLPAGIYAVIGAELFSTNIVGFRLIFDQQWSRPGFIGMNLETSRNPWWEYQQKLGEWGRFRTTNAPRCEVLCNVADTAFTGYLQCVQVQSL